MDSNNLWTTVNDQLCKILPFSKSNKIDNKYLYYIL